MVDRRRDDDEKERRRALFERSIHVRCREIQELGEARSRCLSNRREKFQDSGSPLTRADDNAPSRLTSPAFSFRLSGSLSLSLSVCRELSHRAGVHRCRGRAAAREFYEVNVQKRKDLPPVAYT